MLPDYDVGEVLKTARNVASRYESTGAKISVNEVQRHVSGRRSSTDSPEYKALRSAVENIMGHVPRVMGVGGATCANFFRQKVFDACVWETGGGTLHCSNENVPVFATLFYKLCVEGKN